MSSNTNNSFKGKESQFFTQTNRYLYFKNNQVQLEIRFEHVASGKKITYEELITKRFNYHHAQFHQEYDTIYMNRNGKNIAKFIQLKQ